MLRLAAATLLQGRAAPGTTWSRTLIVAAKASTSSTSQASGSMQSCIGSPIMPPSRQMSILSKLCSGQPQSSPLSTVCIGPRARSLHTTTIAAKRRHPSRINEDGGHRSQELPGEAKESSGQKETGNVNISEDDMKAFRTSSQSESGPTKQEMAMLAQLMQETGEMNSVKTMLRFCKPPSIFGATAFSAVLMLSIFVGAALYSVEHTEAMAVKVTRGGHGGTFGDFSSFFGVHGNDRPPRVTDVVAGEGHFSEQQLRAAHMQTIAQRWGGRLKTVLTCCDNIGFGESFKKFIVRSFDWAVTSYIELPNYQMAAVPIVAINAAIFTAWSVRGMLSYSRSVQWSRFMETAFVHRVSGRWFTLLTSAFSHQGIAHFGFNNIALWSCGAAALVSPSFIFMTREQSSRNEPHIMEASITPHFLAFFASAGVFASLISHLRNAAIWRFTRARSGLSAAAMIGMRGGLGASGAVYATFAMMAEAYPNNRLSLIFLPSASLPISDGFRLMLAIDALGLLLRWRLFDHTAHLAGAAFGFLYYRYGGYFWETMKRGVVEAKAQHETSEKVASSA